MPLPEMSWRPLGPPRTKEENALEELSDIAERLQAWLTDNTEHVFEEEPEIDGARLLILQRIGKL